MFPSGLAFYCCITNYPKFRDFKQRTFVLSVSWVRNVDMA